MSLTERESQALGSVAYDLAGSDPKLASMLNIFSRLAASEEMPVREKIRIQRGWPPARPRRAARHPRRRRPPAALLLWAAISAALLTVALALNACPRANGGSGAPFGRLSAVSAAQSQHP